MKSISEIYNSIQEDSSISTPNNTLGIGNPIPAGINGNEGSEPIPNKKTILLDGLFIWWR